VFYQCIRDLEEEVPRNSTDLLDHLWTVARVVPLEDLQDAAWMLHRFIMHDLARMSMRQQSLAFLSIRHDLLLIVVAGCPFFGSSSLAGRFVCWLLRLPLFRQFVLPARSIVVAMVGPQAREDSLQILGILEIVTHDERGIAIRLYILLEIEVVLEDVVDQSSQESDIAANADRGIDISHLRGAREVGIDMNDGCSSLFGRHDPAKPDRVTFGKVTSLY